MSKKSTYILGILLTIIIGTVLYYFLCCSVCCGKKSCKNKAAKTSVVAAPKVTSASNNAFSVTDKSNGMHIYAEQDNFNFKTSSFSILKPISGQVSTSVLKLKDYLLANPSKTVDITGYYKSKEVNNSAFPNLGLARSNSVKNYLVSRGIPSKQIDTTGKLNDTIEADATNTLFGPLTFNVLNIDANDTSAIDALKTACDAIKREPLIFHFKTGQASINLTAKQRQKIADISHCIDKLGVKVVLVGHTDSAGDAGRNLVLGQQRADFAKNYLIKNGILESNIISTSKGEQEPVADNNTPEGKAENRRTEVTIK